MGRLPTQWAGKVITDRFPYNMSAELTLTSNSPATQFPDSAFLHSLDKPFEVHRLIPRVVANADGGVMLPEQPDQETLAALIRIFITNLGITQTMMKAATRLNALVKGSSERTWEFAEPQVLQRGQEFQTTAQSLTFPVFTPTAAGSLTVILDFQGFLLQVAPPSDNR